MARLSGMELYRRVRKRLRKIRRMQEAYNAAKRSGQAVSSSEASPALTLRATPSGTAGLRLGGRHGYRSQNTSKDTISERSLSVQYLANQKPPTYLHGVFSI